MGSPNGSVGTATTHWTGRPKKRGRAPGTFKIFVPSSKRPYRLRNPSNLLFNEYRDLLPRGIKAAGALN